MSRRQILVLEIMVFILFLIVIFPLLIVTINSAKDNFSVTDKPLALPDNWLNIFRNMKDIWQDENIRYRQSFFSSVVITVFSLLSISFTSAMAGWMLCRTKSRISHIIFLIFVGSMVIPFQVVMFPLVSWFRVFGDFLGIKMLRSYIGIVFAYTGFGAPLSIFLFHGFVKSIPFELEQAAIVDGCSTWQTFIRIVFPILKPVFVTVLILNGIWIWNDFLLPLLILGKGNAIQTIPLAVANFVGAYVKEWGKILTASLMSIIPVIIFFIFGQKFIIKGMVEGSIK